jgi:hypothetical protein
VAAVSPIPDLNQPRAVFSTWLGFVLLFVFFGLLVAVVFGMMPHNDAFEEKRANGRIEKLKAAREEGSKALNGYAVVDKAKGTVRLPIDRAIELTAAELATKQPAPANPIAPADLQNPATQSGVAVPATSPTPAAQGSPTPKPSEVEGHDSMIRGQPTGAANPPAAPPGTQPGPSATPAASPGAPAAQPHTGGTPLPTPVQKPAGTPIPVPGKPR